MKRIFIVSLAVVLTVSVFAQISVVDYDGNVYSTVKIGNQIWMAENLKVTHYPDGTDIPLVTDNTAWAKLGENNTDDAYCYYKNDTNSVYGVLYTWAAAMGDSAVSSSANPSGVQGVCPDGWHLPSDTEWTELKDFLGGAATAGGKMKEIGTSHWNVPNCSADNSSGFSALPGGYRDFHQGSFLNMGYWGIWWSSSVVEYVASLAYSYELYYYLPSLDCVNYMSVKSNGFSVRCVMD